MQEMCNYLLNLDFSVWKMQLIGLKHDVLITHIALQH